jgi:hypothetical protein
MGAPASQSDERRIGEEYPSGGYEVDRAFCDPEVDEMVTGAIRRLLEEPIARRK